MEIKPDIRFLDDIKEVLYDKKWAKTAPNSELYYMYRGIKKRGGLRYDITIIPPRMLGKEFVKTRGNRNSDNFPELYTVLAGKAFFLMQGWRNKIKRDVIAAQMKKGEWIIVPANYYVVAINPSKKILKLGNWVAQKNKNIYKEMEEKRGASYYYTKSGWIKNKNYESVPKLRSEKPLKKMLKDLNFLYGKKRLDF
ncbi:MAG: glucose-6-phosphate isomerase family protein [Patescibacteria group bacterium]